MKRWKVWAAFRKPKDMKGNSKRPKSVMIAVFCASSGGQEFGGKPYEFYFGKGGAAGEAVGVILYMWNWVPVRNGASVECSVVATGPSTDILLGNEMEGGDHGTSARRAVPSRSMASNSALAMAKLSGARWRGRQATGGPGVVRMWCVVSQPAMAPSWSGQPK